jgi:very-short-patch-repair endonuclease
MNVSASVARRLGALPKRPQTDLGKKLARDYRERYENALAAQLDEKGLKYVRQYGFIVGRRFRADFRLGLLLVEVDGGGFVNGRHNRALGREADQERDALALCVGFRVLRVSPNQVMNGKAVGWIEKIRGRMK